MVEQQSEDVVEIHQHRYGAAIAECEWFFAQSEGAVRVSGIDYRSLGATRGVEDEARQHRRHLAMRDMQASAGETIETCAERISKQGGQIGIPTEAGYRAAVSRRAKIGKTLATIPGEEQHVLLTGMTPRRWLGHREYALRERFRFGRSETICLLALALETDALKAMFPKAKKPPGQAGDRKCRETTSGDATFPQEWPTRWALLEWLRSDECSDVTREKASDAAAIRMLQALGQYDIAMRARGDSGSRRERGKERALQLQGVGA